MKSTDDKEVANTVFNFFFCQYKTALMKQINSEAEYNACISANKAAQQEFDNVGWGMKIPYDEYTLSIMKNNREKSSKNLAEAIALFEFIKNHFVEKFVV